MWIIYEFFGVLDLTSENQNIFLFYNTGKLKCIDYQMKLSF